MDLIPGARVPDSKLSVVRVFTENGRSLVKVRCDCGKEKVVQADNVKSGRTRSCGCRYGLTPADRFWLKVNKRGGPDACWDWTGCTDADGYGRAWMGQTTRTAHRIAWELTSGVQADSTKDVCHLCVGNRRCCNPRHLILGTKPRNVEMRVEQRRSASDLTEEDAKVILDLTLAGWSHSRLAEKFGMSTGAIGAVVARRTFKYVEDPRDPIRAALVDALNAGELIAAQTHADLLGVSLSRVQRMLIDPSRVSPAWAGVLGQGKYKPSTE